MNNLEEVVNHYLDISGRTDFKRHCRAAKKLLELTDNNVKLACQKLDATKKWIESWGGEDWKIETTLKKFLEI
jgi:hypothetical protein